MSRLHRPSTALGTTDTGARGSDERRQGLDHRRPEQPNAPSFHRRSTFSPFRRNSQFFSQSNSNSVSTESFQDAGHAIGKAPAPSKPPKPVGLRVKRAKALSISLLGGNPVDTQDNNAPSSSRDKGKSTLRSKFTRPASPALEDTDEEYSTPPRSTSALDFYRNNGPKRGLASHDWSSPTSTSRIPRKVNTRQEDGELYVIGRDLDQQVRQRSVSLSPEQKFSELGLAGNKQNLPQVDEIPASELERSAPGRLWPQTSSRSTASPFLNTYTAQALINSREPTTVTESRIPRSKAPASPLRKTDILRSASLAIDDPTPPATSDTPSSPQRREPSLNRTPSHARIPSASDITPPPQRRHLGHRPRIHSHAFGSPVQDSRLPVPSRADGPPSIIAPPTRIMDRNGRRPESPVRVRPSSPFGISSHQGFAQQGAALQAFGQQIGGMSAAVGRRGWDMVKQWGGSSTPSNPGLSSAPSHIISGGNVPTRRWIAYLNAPTPSDGAASYAGPTKKVFGAPLREAVLLSRLGAIDEVDAKAKLSTLDLGNEFRVDLPSLSPRSSKRLSSDQLVSKVASREEARLKYLPAVVVRCIESVERWGLQEEGIYRLSGRTSHSNKLRSVFDQPISTRDTQGDLDLASISPADLDINSVCSVLKSYLRDLPDHLIPQALVSMFDSAVWEACGVSATGFTPEIAKDPKTDASDLTANDVRGKTTGNVAGAIRPLMGHLPAPNWYLLRELSLHLRDMTSADVVAQTRMPLSNLCLVLAPTLCLSVAMVRTLVEQSEELFGQSCPQSDHQLDNLQVDLATHDGFYVKPSQTSHNLMSVPVDRPTNRLSAATIKPDSKRQSTSSVSTLQNRDTTPTESPSESPIASRFLQKHSPSHASLRSPALGLHDNPTFPALGHNSSGDSSLPSSLWTGDHRSEGSSGITDEGQECMTSSSTAPSIAPSASNSSLRSTANSFAHSEYSRSGRTSALDRPRPPTGGSGKFFSGRAAVRGTSRSGSSSVSSLTSPNSRDDLRPTLQNTDILSAQNRTRTTSKDTTPTSENPQGLGEPPMTLDALRRMWEARRS